MQGVQQTYEPITVHEKAYLYFPSKKDQKTEQGKKGTRFYYFGQIIHDEYERKKMREFQEYIVKHKLNYDRELFDQQRLLLFLQGRGYKPKDTIQAMQIHVDFRKQYLPIDFTRVQKLLRQGYFYPCGRDRFFRPVLVFNATMIDFNDVETGFLAACFVHQQIIKHMFIPGQVQNWVIIYDLGGMGISDMPISALKETSQRLSQNYGGRLFKMVCTNAPGTIWLSWKVVSAFLDQVTCQKIKISKTNTDKSLFETVDPSQVEVKYGGTQPNRKQFWPFVVPNSVYAQDKLVSHEEYEKKLKNGELKRNELHPKYRQNKE